MWKMLILMKTKSRVRFDHPLHMDQPHQLDEGCLRHRRENIAPFLAYELVFDGPSRINSALSHSEAAKVHDLRGERSLVA